MSTGAAVAIIVVIVIVVVIIVGVAVFSATAARRRRLRQRFGPEYHRAVVDQQSQRKAEAELTGRERRVRRLDIRPLTAAARSGYTAQWASVQERFVDQPAQAVTEAQQLVTTVLQDRGYPTERYDQILADLSVDHARNLEHYRAAHAVSESAASGLASTEDLRQAMIHYRAMFDDLLRDVAGAQQSAQPDTTAATPDGAATEAPEGLAAPSGRAAAMPAGEAAASGGATAAPAESGPTVTGDRAADTRS